MTELVVTIRDFNQGYSVLYDPQLTELMGKQHWTVQENYCYFLGTKYSNIWSLVPRGYGSDGASVPSEFTDILPVWGRHGPEILLHDYLCEYGYVYCLLPDGSVGRKALTREQIDAVFIEALQVQGYPAEKIFAVKAAFAVHRAVSRPPVPNLDTQKMQWEASQRIRKGWCIPRGEDLYTMLIAQGDMAAKDALAFNKQLVAGGGTVTIPVS